MSNQSPVKALVTVSAMGGQMVYATALYADPAVFFNPDLDAGRDRFNQVIDSTVNASTTVERYVLNLSSATTSGGLYSVTGTEGSTTFVRLSVNGNTLTEGNFGATDGIYNTSVSISNTGMSAWNEAVDEGFKVEFYSDASGTTPVTMNALGMEVEDWGTCCFGSFDNNGDASAATSVFAVFDPDADPSGNATTINLIGGIESSSDRGTFAGTLANGSSTNTNNHFVAAINDTNTFSSIAIVPNGDGEAFGYGGILHFSKVALGSVPAGSSEVVVGSATDIVDPSSSQDDLGTALNYVFDGGELLVDSNSSAGFTIKAGGGTINTQSNTVVFSGDLTGPGQLDVTGTGTLTLTGSNTYAGGTSVTSGTLSTAGGGTLADDGAIQIASGATFVAGTPDTVGAVTNNGTFDVDAPLDVASLDNAGTTNLDSVLSSTGDITNASGSVMNMNADVNAGGEFIAEGTINVAGTQRLTSGSLSGDGAFDIAAGGALELDVDADSHFAGAISGGDGDFLKLGDSVLELSGANVSRSATVAEGTLHLLGSFTAPRFDVNGGATLSGTGSIDGDLEVTGRLAPGDSPGTITVNGDVTFVSGSLFSVEIDGRAYSPAGGPGSYDRLVVTGADSVVFAGGTIEPQLRGISAANNDFTPIIGDVFRVIETEDNPAGVSGTFDTLVATPNGLTDGTRFSVVYGGDYVDLAVIPDDFGAFAQTYEYDNMTQAAAAFETIFTPQVAASEFLNGLNALSQDRLALALLEASGEIHAFTLSGVKHGSRSLSASALDYLGTTPDGRLIWSDIRGLSVDIEDDEIASMHRADHHQLWLGADFLQTEDMRVGAAFGYAGGTIDAAVSGSSDYDGLNLALYYHRELGAFEFSGIAGVGVVEMTTARSTSLSTGTTSNTSESQANLAFVEGRVSHEQDFGTTLSGTAWSSLRFDVVRGDGFTEAGSALTSLAVGEQTDRSATVSIGYDLVGDFQIGARDAEWRLGVGATRTTQNGRISGRDLSLHGASWRVSSPDADSVSGFISSGVSIDIADNGYLDLSLRADGAEGWGAYGAAVGFGVQW